MQHPCFRLLPILTLLGFAAVLPASAQVPSRNVVLEAHLDEYFDPAVPSSYAACWSYVHEDGREYAVIGTRDGTAIYNVTVPASSYRVGFVPGPSCLWREMKSYRNWIYVVTECPGTGEGVQIIRMTDPENPVLAGTYTTNFNRSHTVSVDTTRALLICNGTRNGDKVATGMRILSLADPENPVEISWWPGGAVPVSSTFYVHDSVPIGDRLYASSINAGIQRVIDFSVPALPTEIHSWSYPGAFSHNAWPDSSGEWLYVTDEVNGEPLKIFDISDLQNPILANGITSNPEAIVHNAHVRGDELYLSNYTEGIRILDLSDPAHPAEFAWADSWPGSSGGFRGVWEVCPYFPSGTVIASDMQSGLYVYRVSRDYGLVTVEVTDADTGQPLAGAEAYLIEQGDSLVVPADGVVRFAPSPGSHTVRAALFGYEEGEAVVPVSVGSDDTVRFALAAKPLVDFTGLLLDESDDAPLEDGEVRLRFTPLHEHTDAAGAFTMSEVPSDVYQVEAVRPGYERRVLVREIAPPIASQTLRLRAADHYDDLESESGWQVGAPGDDAMTGIWTRVEPLGTGAPSPPGLSTRSGRDPLLRRPGLGLRHEGHETDGALPGDVQPETDRTPGAGTLCFVTGQGSNPGNIGENDVDGGVTTLTTPNLDATPFVDPALGYWRWFYGSGDENDRLVVSISDDGGGSWVGVDTTSGIESHWVFREIRVADHVTPTAQVRLRFQAEDGGAASIVEAAVDDLVLYDASLPAVDAPGGPRRVGLALRLHSPNPARGAVRLSLAAAPDREVELSLYDVRGRRVRVLWRGPVPPEGRPVVWDGRDARGARAPAGLYFAVARSDRERALARIVRLP